MAAEDLMTVPASMAKVFARFRRDFDLVTTTWMIRGEESESTVEALRQGVRGILAAPSTAERDATLAALFDYWHDLRMRICPHGVAIEPQLDTEAEMRIAKAHRLRGSTHV